MATEIILNQFKSLKKTIGFRIYWEFAAERQNIFFRRIYREKPPWTKDKILQEYKFTNAYRAADRVSQYLIKHIIYNENYDQSDKETFFRIMLFKLFNKIETWETLEKSMGTPSWQGFNYNKYDKIFSMELLDKKRIFSAAYIMPSGKTSFGHQRKHGNILNLIEKMMNEKLYEKLKKANTMKKGFEIFKSYPMIGDFLAYQFITDVNYSTITDFSEMEFVVPGPGAIRGIKKCFHDIGKFNMPDIIEYMATNQDEEFAKFEIEFQGLWGRKLQFIDCQNLFCEVDKYLRVFSPELGNDCAGKRIKQRLKPNFEKIEFWFPPKWNIAPSTS